MNSVHVVLCVVLVGFTFGVLGLLWYLDRLDKREEAACASEAPTHFVRIDDYHPLVARISRNESRDDYARQSGGNGSTDIRADLTCGVRRSGSAPPPRAAIPKACVLGTHEGARDSSVASQA